MLGGIGATVRVRVRSAGGRRGQAQCRIDILPRVPAPGVFTCVAGGFRLRSYALRDIDMACIDDVCTRLQWSPRERLLIVGHADRHERNPHHIGLKRAGRAAIYAVDYRDLPRARIRIASAGAARPLDEGQGSAARARNRRVELTIFALPVPA
ncbi:MAG TPA: OmpA family protein [Methylomirabilota bacterium]